MPFSSSGPASSTTRLPRGETIRRRADEDLSGACSLLQPRGEIHGLAGRERRLGVVDDDLARLDADTRLELELVDRRAHRERGARRALRVVLVCLRHAERRHHGVSGELLDDAAVLVDAGRDHLEEPLTRRRTTSGSAPVTRRVESTMSTNRTDASLRSMTEV